MPKRLEALQGAFVASIVGAAALPGFTARVRGGGRLDPSGAVEVYRRAYPARMSEALGETFEACWRALGDDDFLPACAEYARLVPSRSHDLSDYGASFPGFLKTRFADFAPWIEDLGLLCWAFKEVFHAAPGAGLAAGDLAARAGGASRLGLVAARRRLSLAHRVHALWARSRSDETPVAAADCAGPQHLLVYRSGGSAVFVRVLSPDESAALAALEGGETVENALAASGLDPAGAARLFAFLANSSLVENIKS